MITWAGGGGRGGCGCGLPALNVSKEGGGGRVIYY